MKVEQVPLEPTSELWSGELAPRPDLDDGGARDFPYRRLEPDELEGELPVVSIGQPEVLRSLSGFSPEGLESIAPKDFYLVRLWCSFRGFESEIEFERAHFQLSLSSPSGPEGSLIAHDMHPSEVLYKVERNLQVSFSPEVNFTAAGGKLGSFDYGLSYTELQPRIVAYGYGEASPSWMFSATKGYKLQGGKAVHLVVAAPTGTRHGTIALDIVAWVRKPNTVSLPWGLFEKRGKVAAQPLSVQLW